jgi:hypothetical protein
LYLVFRLRFALLVSLHWHHEKEKTTSFWSGGLKNYLVKNQNMNATVNPAAT